MIQKWHTWAALIELSENSKKTLWASPDLEEGFCKFSKYLLKSMESKYSITSRAATLAFSADFESGNAAHKIHIIDWKNADLQAQLSPVRCIK